MMMVKSMMILDTFPSPEVFYSTYWGKKPFIVRGFVDSDVIDCLVDGDTLAGLALEEDIKSRIITNNKEGNDWSCAHGPFDEDVFDGLGEQDWSLLVQNVEQYHTDTAQLLEYFQFSPRWLMDDIMVSFSALGGSVGPHTDSYHTFLVQGIGKREWKISEKPIDDERYVDNPDVKVLQYGFEGETFEVTAGDVIYMPPFFGHEGKTLEAAMTFSVGFLGPKLSEMLGEYAQYLEENDALNKRYLGAELGTDSAAFNLSLTTQSAVKGDLIASLQSEGFSAWMASYFSAPTHEDVDNITIREEPLSGDELFDALHEGATVYRPEHVKLAITMQAQGGGHLAVYRDVFYVSQAQSTLIDKLNNSESIALNDLCQFGDRDEAISLIVALYNKNALILE